MGRLLTVGHGTLDRDDLAALLTGAAVDLLVDVRRFPGSRHNPDVSSDALAAWLPEAGIEYRWEERLGGRRRRDKGADPDADGWWRVEAFRAYAAHTRTPDFIAAIDDLCEDVAARGTTAVMCSEAVWWRCHRRLVADAMVVRGYTVLEIISGGTPKEHQLTPFAVVEGTRVTYPGSDEGEPAGE